MPAYCLFDLVEITDPEKMREYAELVYDTVEAYQGRILFRGGRCEQIEGELPLHFPVLLEFPSIELAHRWYDSEEYRYPLKLRLEASRANAVFIDAA